MADVSMVSVREASVRLGLSRQALWEKVRGGALNWIDDEGEILIYLDSRWEAYSRSKRRGPAPSGTRGRPRSKNRT